MFQLTISHLTKTILVIKTFMKVSPPLRKEDDRKALIKGIKDGYIDVIVSDHKPEDEELSLIHI